MTAGGLGILMFSLVDAVNLDLDGFFELLILGTAGVAIGHTMVTTIIGPLIFGRILCGWGCWRAMVLERLPVGKGSGRRRGVWVWIPLVGVAISFVAAALFALAPGHLRIDRPEVPDGQKRQQPGDQHQRHQAEHQPGVFPSPVVHELLRNHAVPRHHPGHQREQEPDPYLN